MNIPLIPCDLSDGWVATWFDNAKNKPMTCEVIAFVVTEHGENPQGQILVAVQPVVTNGKAVFPLDSGAYELHRYPQRVYDGAVPSPEPTVSCVTMEPPRVEVVEPEPSTFKTPTHTTSVYGLREGKHRVRVLNGEVKVWDIDARVYVEPIAYSGDGPNDGEQ